MKHLLALLTISLILVSSCKKDNPVIPPLTDPPKAVSLSLADVSCTEAFIRVIAADSVLPLSISLTRDENEIANFALTQPDTVIIDTSLQPDNIYTYQTIVGINGTDEKSDTIEVRTLKVSSDNFTWQTFTFGDSAYGSSKLNDVVIIDENNIWAVGEINNDATGQAYNAVHWDGHSWVLKRILFYGICGQTVLVPYPAKAIFTTGNDTVWIAMDGDQITRLVRGVQTQPLCLPSSYAINKMWGRNNEDFYMVGSAGNITHYENGNWSNIESGTTSNINDIWGVKDSSANNLLVLCTVSNRYESGDYKLLSVSGNTSTEYISWPHARLYGVWFNTPQKIYIVGDGAYVYMNNSLRTINLPTNYFKTRIKGNALNDIFISVSNAQVLHYNGINWSEIYYGIYGSYEGMDVKGNTIASVGYNIEGGMVGKAVVTIGTRH
jgi:hypothetical protein